METSTLITILQIAAIPLAGLLINWYIKRQERASSERIADLGNLAERRIAEGTFSNAAIDAGQRAIKMSRELLGTMPQDIERLSQENTLLQKQVKELADENKKLKGEQVRLTELAKNQRGKIEHQALQIDELIKRLTVLENLENTRQSEIRALVVENSRLTDKINRISDEIDTGKFKEKK